MAGSDNRLKTPVVRSLSQLAGQRAGDAAQSTAKRLPAIVISRSKQFVTVATQMQVGGVGGPWTLVKLTVPIATTQTDWIPLKAGAVGVLQASDYYLGGVSKDGNGTADYSQRGNLATLYFHPISQKDWDPPGGDGDKRIIQGPNGVYMQDDAGTAKFTLDKTNGFKLEVGNHTFEVKSTGIFFDGINLITHEHAGVTVGGAKTGGPTDP